MKYGAIVKGSYWEAGYDSRDSGGTVNYEYFKSFEKLEELEEFLIRDSQKGFSATVKKVIKYEELNYSTKLVIEGLK